MIVALLLVLTLSIVYLIYKRIELFKTFSRLGIPGPSPNFFVGNMMEMMGKGKLVTDVMSTWESQFGPIYGYFRGTRATLVVRDTEVIKDILVRKSADFINRPIMIINVPPVADTVVGLRSKRWKQVRNTLSHSFSSAKIKQMFPIMADCVKTSVQILKEKHENSFSERQVVDAHKLFQGLACDVICCCALAMKVNSQRDEQDKFYMAVRGFLDNAMGPFVKIALCFPLIAQIMEKALLTFGYSHEMTKMIMSNVQAEMKARRDKKEVNQNTSNDFSTPRDALQLMMESQTDTSTLSDDEIVANSWVFILGGFETTSSALSYTCYLLSINQDIQEKMLEELKSSFTVRNLNILCVVHLLLPRHQDHLPRSIRCNYDLETLMMIVCRIAYTYSRYVILHKYFL